MKYQLSYSKIKEISEIDLPSSKSISNRLLIARTLAKNNFKIENLSDAKDTIILHKALNSDEEEVNVDMAGTAYRFLTAYYALNTKGKRKVLTGAKRIKQRPIKALVAALQNIGAEIEYMEKEGFPPLAIVGKELNGGEHEIEASTSSQFISALLLVAPYLKDDLDLKLSGDMVSLPYIDMTIEIMNQLGIEISRKKNNIKIKKGEYEHATGIVVEQDWSSAAFFYQMVALGINEIVLKGLREDSIQGDRYLVEIFERLGVKSTFIHNGLRLRKGKFQESKAEFELRKYPDLIPSLIVTVACLLDEAIIKGTKTLYIKESNRIQALQMELRKLGAIIERIDEDTIRVYRIKESVENVKFDVYNDHRIAMCLTPLALKFNITLSDVEVVSKSFPNFFNQLEKIGIKLRPV